MTRQVALSERAYRRLKSRKFSGESFSNAIERLLDAEGKDPMAFVGKHSGGISPKDQLRQVEEDREASWVDA